MNPNITANQQRRFLEFFARLRPHLAHDSGLPRRLKEMLSHDRAIGSRDRRLYRELLYTAVRFLPWVDGLLGSEIDCRAAARRHAASSSPDGTASSAGPTGPELASKIIAWLAPELKPTSLYRAAHCGDWPAVPATLAEKAILLESMHARYPLLATRYSPEALLPAWFRSHCPPAFAPPHLDAINERANLWVRLQVDDRAHVLAEFSGKGWAPLIPGEPPDAVCLPPNAEVAATDAYRRGFCEIQDLGSQLVLLQAPVAPGQIWLDACAGAGGKTLQLARLVGDTGRVDATDIRPQMLTELTERATRARLDNIRLVRAPETLYDGVLVDAPCSGTGTWRRLPHMKWYTQPAMLIAFAAEQLAILRENAAHVRPDGLLVYATCSLSHVENHDVVAAFLAQHAEFSVETPARDWGTVSDGLGHTLLPGTRNSDGFYVALLRRTH